MQISVGKIMNNELNVSIWSVGPIFNVGIISRDRGKTIYIFFAEWYNMSGTIKLFILKLNYKLEDF